MKIAVLFDGAGLARLGLEQAGHECTGFELSKVRHVLGTFVGSGNTRHMDVLDADLSEFDAVWASPPCQSRSQARTQGAPQSTFSEDLVTWCMSLPHDVLWVENVLGDSNRWGTLYNAAQFTDPPIQCRNRVIGGRHAKPKTFRGYAKDYGPLVCPCITATEYKGCASDTRRASRYYGRKLTLDEVAHHQGFTIPAIWRNVPKGWSESQWLKVLYSAIGDGVPVYMARAFGEAES